MALLAASAGAAAEVNFITCPVYRDTDNGRKSGCWLGEDPASGIRYDITQSAAKPDWNFAVLVEGRVAVSPDDPCGGAVLDPVRVSILQDQPCTRHMIPAEGFKGRKYVLPKRNIDPLSVVRAKPQPPFATRSFRLFFDWNSDFIAYQREDHSLDMAIAWIRGAPVRSLTVTGYAATTPFNVSGQAMAEEKGMGQIRADHVAEALYRLGIPKAKIVTRDGGDGGVIADALADDLPQASRRRVEIVAEVAE